MKIIKLYTGDDNKSHFADVEISIETQRKLGGYSKAHIVNEMFIREFDAGALYDLHNAPQRQYIIYLDGDVEVQASDGEVRVFRSGDILHVTDTHGEGHITKTLTAGRSLIVTEDI